MKAAPAPRDDALELLEARWTLRILLLLAERAHRFSDLRLQLPPISANILTSRMRALEKAGLVVRTSLPPPASVQVYTLAAEANALRPMLAELRRWRAQQDYKGAQGSRFVQTTCTTAF